MSKKNVAVIDYGIGNVASVVGAIEKVGHTAILTSDADKLLASDCAVLPGVGAFGDGMSNLLSRRLDNTITTYALELKKPLLGICLGMQLLASKSYEFGEYAGLGLIDGAVHPLPITSNLRRIHIGWNDLNISLKEPIFRDLINPIAYFVHGYHFIPANSDTVIATTDYGFDVVAGIRKDNIIGLQFHPEKSQKDGLLILKNFIESN